MQWIVCSTFFFRSAGSRGEKALMRREAAETDAVDEGRPLQLLQIAVGLIGHLPMQNLDAAKAPLGRQGDAFFNVPQVLVLETARKNKSTPQTAAKEPASSRPRPATCDSWQRLPIQPWQRPASYGRVVIVKNPYHKFRRARSRRATFTN